MYLFLRTRSEISRTFWKNYVEPYTIIGHLWGSGYSVLMGKEWIFMLVHLIHINNGGNQADESTTVGVSKVFHALWPKSIQSVDSEKQFYQYSMLNRWATG